MNDNNMKNDGLYTLKEYQELAHRRQQKRGVLVEMHDDDETFEIVGSSWWAKYSSVNTPEKMLACIYHLSTKAWISREHIHELISKLNARFNFAIDIFDAMD